uniref:Uncharacterized protein n=1 Tax=Brassica oleracea var. oleracea TaxID=109376 RepID=A0A0D3D312_BRAOL
MKKHRYVLVNINQAMDKSFYEEKPICRVKRAPNQKLILNHKLKTSIHQRATKYHILCGLDHKPRNASTLMKRLYYQECGPEEGKLHSIHWGCIRY